MDTTLKVAYSKGGLTKAKYSFSTTTLSVIGFVMFQPAQIVYKLVPAICISELSTSCTIGFSVSKCYTMKTD